MTFEQKLEFFEAYRDNFYKARGLCNELNQWQQIIGCPANPIQAAKPKNSTGTNQIEQHFVVESDLLDTIQSEIVRAAANRKKIIETIFTVTDTIDRNLLRDKYIYFLSNNEIAKSAQIDPRTVSRRVRKIIDKLDVVEVLEYE